MLSSCDLCVNIEQKIINDQNQLFVAVSNQGNTEASAEVKLYAGDENGRLLNTFDLETVSTNKTVQYIVELDSLLNDDDEIITCIVTADNDPYITNNVASLKLFKITSDSYAVAEKDSIENPTLDSNGSVFDKYSDQTVMITITAGLEHFSGITGLNTGSDYLMENGIITLSKQYLDTLVADTTLEIAFDYGDDGIVYRNYLLTITDSTPISISGIVTITGAVNPNVTVIADVSAIQPTDANLSYQWLLDNVEVETEREFQIPSDAIGKTLTLLVTGINGYQGTLQYGIIIEKSTPSAPKSLIVQSITNNSITFVTITGAEYSIDGMTWQDNHSFDGLLPNTEYTFIARYRATETTYASDIISVSVRTLKNNALVPKVPEVSLITDTSVTLTAINGYEYRCDDGEWQQSTIFNDLLPNKTYVFYQRIAETDISYASDSSVGILITTLQSQLSICGTVTSYDDVTASVTIVLLQGETVITNQTTTDGSYSFTNLSSGTYILRFSKVRHCTREYTVTLDSSGIILDAVIRLYGDVNGDGEIDIFDILMMVNYLNGDMELDDIDVKAGLVVNEEEMDIFDVLAMVNYLNGDATLPDKSGMVG